MGLPAAFFVPLFVLIPLAGALTLPALGFYLSVTLYAAVSTLAVGLYLKDKAAARRGARRIPERQLQYVALAGGWPGALLARALLPHKLRKVRFSAVLFAIVWLHQGAWLYRLITIGHESFWL